MKVEWSKIIKKANLQLIVTNEDFSDIIKNKNRVRIGNKLYDKFDVPLGVPFGRDIAVNETKINLIEEKVEFLE